MTIHGFGLGASVVGGFSDAHKSAIKCGFPDTIDTYGLVSGLWTSVFALGNFVGPTLAGVMYEEVGGRADLYMDSLLLQSTINHILDKILSII